MPPQSALPQMVTAALLRGMTPSDTVQILALGFLSCFFFFFSVLLAESTREGEVILIPHSVVIGAVLTCPGMLCTLQGHPPEATRIAPLPNSALGVGPALCCFEVS